MKNIFIKLITKLVNRKSNNVLNSQIFFNLPLNKKNVLNEKWVLEKSWINLLTLRAAKKDISTNTFHYQFSLSKRLISKEQQNKIIKFFNKQNRLYKYTLLRKVAKLKNIQTPKHNTYVQYIIE